MKLIDMKLSDEEKKEQTQPPAEMEGEQYPWGVCLDLDDGTLAKLGITKLPEIGTVMVVEARAKVVGINEAANESAESKSVRLQIIEMGVQADAKPRSPGQRVYGD
jgi:hypothetical protein